MRSEVKHGAALRSSLESWSSAKGLSGTSLSEHRPSPTNLQITLKDVWIALRYVWITLRDVWITLRDVWITLRDVWITLRDVWITLREVPDRLYEPRAAIFVDLDTMIKLLT